MGSLVGLALILVGVGGGVASLLLDNAVAEKAFPVAAPALAATGVYLISKEVWEGAQSKLDEHERRKPLEVIATDHEDRWRRLVIYNPNDFVVTDAFVAVQKYHQVTMPLDFTLRPPSQGTVFRWGTWQKSNGNIGARGRLIVDILFQPNEDHFGHVTPDDPVAFPLTYGDCDIDIVLGSTGTVIPESLYTLEARFPDKATLTLEFLEFKKPTRRTAVIPSQTHAFGALCDES